MIIVFQIKKKTYLFEVMLNRDCNMCEDSIKNY